MSDPATTSAATGTGLAVLRRRVFVAGATGYIGQHVVRELVMRGHEVVAFARPRAGIGGILTETEIRRRLDGCEVRFGDVCDPAAVVTAGFRDEAFEAVVSCLGTRGGGVADAWRVEFEAQRNLLEAARRSQVRHFVQLSAICVQKPKLAFQHAKLAFERCLVESGLDYSIVRPTAFFKSLAGQVERVKAGKPFLVFGDGHLTACTPISERDLARYLVDCLSDPTRRNRILPVGGSGPALTPRAQGELLFELCGRPARFRRVPVAAFGAAIAVLGALGRWSPGMADRAEFARIGRYYATESMLVWNEREGRYDAAATPAFGADTLRDFYARVLREGMADQALGDHAMF
ncbi:MAG: NAD(P)H-binding protein [Pseudomonadales bacterium]|nr:NAD(P)H-binding protein [Pseudomonadales bacterium]